MAAASLAAGSVRAGCRQHFGAPAAPTAARRRLLLMAACAAIHCVARAPAPQACDLGLSSLVLLTTNAACPERSPALPSPTTQACDFGLSDFFKPEQRFSALIGSAYYVVGWEGREWFGGRLRWGGRPCDASCGIRWRGCRTSRLVRWARDAVHESAAATRAALPRRRCPAGARGAAPQLRAGVRHLEPG